MNASILDRGEAGATRDRVWILALAVLIWGTNAVWLLRDSRPPVWDMALHQSYALNYIQAGPPQGVAVRSWALSGNYPPFVHLVIACLYLIVHPAPRVAALANIPATLLLLWALFHLTRDLAGSSAARWTCLLASLTPYLFWMSRETILDYWLSAWVAVSLLFLHRSRGFEERTTSLVLGCSMTLGMLTKWFFAGFLLFPLLHAFIRYRVWRNNRAMVNFADALLMTGLFAGIWYLPNIPALLRYFRENMHIGALEGEPPVVSFQSLIYYLRLLEGYQLFAILFGVSVVGWGLLRRRHFVRDAGFLVSAVVGGWLVLTVLRTKDPRFTMPLLGLILIPAGAWIANWTRSKTLNAARVLLTSVLLFQAYVINFGVSWLPQDIVFVRGYQGALRWDWNFYLQHYFHILGAPRRETWHQDEIVRRIDDDAARNGLRRSLAVIPDLPRFNASNLHLYARLSRLRMRVDHIQSSSAGIRSFEGFDYVLMTEGEQGMPWSTKASRSLNQIVVDEHEVFRLLEIYPLPNGDSMRLYSIRRADRAPG